MILRRVKLHPFAGHADTELRFAEGLNVLTGDNDVGKTTVFRAIEHALFTPTALKMNTSQGREFMRTCIPIGGDYAAVTLELEKDGACYVLDKRWGEGAACSLRQPDGVVVTLAAKVQERLGELMPAQEGSFRSILFAPQGSLLRTIGELTENPGVLQSLGDLLRAAVSETGGVSVDRLKARAETERDAVFKFWDLAAGRPKDGRDIGNEWAERSQGSLLRAYYAMRRLQKLAVEVEATEAEFGDKSARLGTVQSRERELAAYVTLHEPLIEADTRREGLVLKLRQATQDAAGAAADFAAWTGAVAALPMLTQDLAARKERGQGVKAELTRASAAASGREVLRRYREIGIEKAALDERTARLAATPEVNVEDLQALRRSARLVDTLRAGLSGGKIRLAFEPKSPQIAVVATDLEPQSRRTLEAGKSVSLEALGRIRIETEGFSLVVTSGEGDRDALEAQFRSAGADVARLLAKIGAVSIEDAEERAARFQDATASLRNARAAFAKLLGPETLEQWQAKAAALENAPALRPLDIVQAEYERELKEYAEVRAKERATLELVEKLRARYAVGEPSELLPVLLERERRKGAAQVELDALPPLPADVGDPLEYRRRFRAARDEAQRLKSEVEALLPKIAELRAKLPELSAQAYLRQARDAEVEFRREQRRGEAVLRVLREIGSLEAAADDVYGELRTAFTGYATRLSHRKYASARMSAALPETFRRRDGIDVPFDLLSTGTKDAFALSLRLSMAQYFLGRARGVILMDDPMVSMDAGRRRVTVEVLSEFAARTQLLLFTCHDTHADALGGHRVTLQSP